MGHSFDRLHHTSGSCESRDQKEEFYEGGNLCFWGAEAVTTRRAERFGWASGTCTNAGNMMTLWDWLLDEPAIKVIP